MAREGNRCFKSEFRSETWAASLMTTIAWASAVPTKCTGCPCMQNLQGEMTMIWSGRIPHSVWWIVARFRWSGYLETLWIFEWKWSESGYSSLDLPMHSPVGPLVQPRSHSSSFLLHLHPHLYQT
jgi:hypothetical protein